MHAINRAAVSACLALGLAASLSTGVVAPAEGKAAPTCQGVKATIVGTPGKDVIRGTKRRDVIVALGGDDIVHAGAGNDLVCGGKGADTLNGGRGNDRLYGGQDRIGYDRGGRWRMGDLLRGGPGDDFLDPGQQRATPGFSVYRHDLINYGTAVRGVTANLTTRRVVGQGHDTFTTSPHFGFVGSPHADTIDGSPEADYIEGAKGNDVIRGGAGADEIYTEVSLGEHDRDHDVVHGGDGNDRISSSHGRDVIFGDAGADQIFARSHEGSEVHAGAGDDSVEQYVTRESGTISDPGDGVNDLRINVAVENPAIAARLRLWVDLGRSTLRLGQGQAGSIGVWDSIYFVGNTRLVYAGTDARDEIVVAMHGPLRAHTFGGDDDIFGSPRGDYIDAGDGVDRIRGAGGRDTCVNGEEVQDCELP